MDQQAKDEPVGNRTRVSIYFSKEVLDELRDFIANLPFGGASMSGFVESAVRKEMERIKKEGYHMPPLK